MEKVINLNGEKELAASVIATLIKDIQLFEDNHDRVWLDNENDQRKKESIYKNAEDAIYCAFSKNKTLLIWLEFLDISLNKFMNEIIKNYPLAFCYFCKVK